MMHQYMRPKVNIFNFTLDTKPLFDNLQIGLILTLMLFLFLFYDFASLSNQASKNNKIDVIAFDVPNLGIDFKIGPRFYNVCNLDVISKQTIDT